jgi:ATP-dependent helicase/nuclease subunit B
LPRIEAAERARFEPALNAYDGVFGEDGVDALRAHRTTGRPMSATAAEKYATCPYRYLLSNLMRLAPVEEPEAITRLGALERGALYHNVLERFLSELGTYPRADRRDDELARLEAIAHEECDAAEERGLTGYPLLWRRDRREILEDVRAWYERELDDQERFPQRAFEVGFGAAHPRERQSELSSDEPLVLSVGGHELRFHGFIDRLEWSTERFQIVDYKTGVKGKLYKDDALAGGQKLQLALYLHAAQLITGLSPEAGAAEYWFATRRGEFKQVGFKGDTLAARREDFDLVLGTIAAAIADGDFHAEPGDYCRWCDFTTICDARREAIRRAKSDDARIARFERMREVT